MNSGQAAVIAEVSEDWTTPVDAAMKALGGVIHRRAKTDVGDSSFLEDYSGYLYPYEYEPRFKP